MWGEQRTLTKALRLSSIATLQSLPGHDKGNSHPASGERNRTQKPVLQTWVLARGGAAGHSDTAASLCVGQSPFSPALV